jgi:chromate transporter
VVGVIATLALLLAKVILFPDGWTGGVDWRAAALSVAAGLALEKFDWPLPFVLAACALGGSVLRLL